METVQVSRLVWENGTPWVWAAAALLVVLGWWGIWSGLRKSRAGFRRRALLGLRGVNLCLLAMLLLGPALGREWWRPGEGKLALLLDTSASMNVASAGKTRLQQVTEWLERSSWPNNTAVESYWFDRRCLLAGSARPQPASDGQGTDILGALEAVARSEAEPPTSILLVSDGADTELLRDLPPGEELPPEALRRLKALSLPVDTVAVGTGGDFVDLAVQEVNAPAFAYVRNAVEIEVELTATGTGELQVPLKLELGGRTIDSRAVQVSPQRNGKAKLKFVPDEIGRLALQVQAPVPEGDALPENNRKAFVIRVVRDKIRVLHVVGRPQWDVRFLREFLKTEPNIDLVSFYILRNLADAPGVSEDELSLIPFPVHQLFGSELDTFDLVIMHNFNHAPYLVSFYLAPLADYVRRGGALCMIGGELSFGSGGYGQTPLEGVLAVRLFGGGDYETGSFHPLTGEDARGHPILETGAADWKDLPALDSFNRAASLADGAEALLVHPFQSAGGRPAPLLAVRQVGRGRSAALLTDSLWRWRFSGTERASLRTVYHRLWQNLLRWLIRDPQMAPLLLEAEQQPQPAGKAPAVEVRRRGHLAEGRTLLKLRRLGGEKTLEEKILEAGSGGRRRVEFKPLPPGQYLVEAFDQANGEKLAEEILLVGEQGNEQKALRPRPDILQKIAQASGGRHTTIEQADSGAFAPRPAMRLAASATSPLLARGWLLAALVLLWSVEWWLRRRWGFS